MRKGGNPQYDQVYPMPVPQKMPANERELCVSRHMRVQEVLALFPQAADVMQEYGLHCFACDLVGVETLEEGCQAHHMDDEMIDELIDDINTAIAESPKREWVLTITPAAAEGIAAIAEAEGRKYQALRVAVDAEGSFCLEFCEEPGEFDRVFPCEGRQDVRVFASPLALQRVGGGTIDMRDGRFKLDLPEEQKSCCSDGECSCGTAS